MKFSTIAIAAIGSFSSQAFALAPTAAVDLTVYSAGSSANRAVVGGLLLQNCGSEIDVYYSSIVAGGDFTTDAANGDSHRVYSCTFKTTGVDPEFAAFAGKKIRFFKRDAGGSGIGVFNIASGTAQALDTTSCTATGIAYPAVPQYLCTKNSAPTTPLHYGFSDVEPALFKGANTPAGFANGGANLSGFTTVPITQTIFGVAVNKQLRNALQAAQGLAVGSYLPDLSNQPSISRAVAGSLFRGELQDPDNGLAWHVLGVANPTNQVNICRRVPGSGTQSAANLFYSGFPCAQSASPIAANADSGLPNSITGPFNGNPFYVYEGSSTGNVISCLTNADNSVNATGTYAIGHVSLENASNGSWDHVKLDGVSPTRANATSGKYDYVYSLTAQWKAANLSADQLSFVTQFTKAAQSASNLAKLSAANQAGVTALAPAGVFNPTANQTNTVGGGDITRFYTRMQRGLSSCTPYGVVQ